MQSIALLWIQLPEHVSMLQTYKPHSWHIGVRFCQVRELIQEGKEVVIEYCGTDKMVADRLTKPLVKAKHAVFVKMCGLE